jgi:hypothetical protein
MRGEVRLEEDTGSPNCGFERFRIAESLGLRQRVPQVRSGLHDRARQCLHAALTLCNPREIREQQSRVLLPRNELTQRFRNHGGFR